MQLRCGLKWPKQRYFVDSINLLNRIPIQITCMVPESANCWTTPLNTVCIGGIHIGLGGCRNPSPLLLWNRLFLPDRAWLLQQIPSQQSEVWRIGWTTVKSRKLAPPESYNPQKISTTEFLLLFSYWEIKWKKITFDKTSWKKLIVRSSRK